MANDRRNFLTGLRITIGGSALDLTDVPVIGPAAAQDTPSKPLLHIPEDVSPEFQEYLRTLKDPALMPRFPDPSDLDSWKKVYEGMPHNFATRVPEAPESKVARKKIADFARKYLGDAPGSGR
jgi:hypothetical protein